MQTAPPKVLAIHDLSGLGRVSLSVVIPILSSLGAQVISLPTSLLSASTAFKGYSFLDLTDNMKTMIAHWATMELRFDAIYSGFIGSVEQCNIIGAAVDRFRKEDSLVVVDPVLGDDGHLYECFGSEHVAQMRKLIKRANIITPNITEARLLLGVNDDSITLDILKGWTRTLASMHTCSKSHEHPINTNWNQVEELDFASSCTAFPPARCSWC